MRLRKETPTHRTWRLMLQRVRHQKAYVDVHVCDRWLDYENFLLDMGKRPEGMTIDRIDNDGDYCPENCRWATRKEQALNRKSTTQITYCGKTLSMREWSELLKMSYTALYQRIFSYSWSVERAFETPIRRLPK